MAWSSGRAVLAAIAVVASPVALADEWDGDMGYRTEDVSSCPFGPRGKGKLRRVSDVIQGANMSSGTESFQLLLNDKEVLDLFQEGPVEGGGGNRVDDPWEISCTPGRVTITVHEDTVELLFRNGEIKFDPAWAKTLERGAPKRSAVRWGQVVEVLRELTEIDQESLEAAMLSWTEALIEEGRWDVAQRLLDATSVGLSGRREKWHAALASSLASLQKRPPLRVARPRRIGALMGEQIIPPGQEPTLFWRESSLCVIQELGAPRRMRCFDTLQSRWGSIEPAIDPVAAAGRWTHEYCGGPCWYKTIWSVETSPGTMEAAGYGEVHEVVAYAPDRSLLFHRKGEFIVARVRSEDQVVGGGELNEILGKTPGTRVAGGGRFVFAADGSLSDAQVPGRWWPPLVETVGRDVWGDWGCDGPPLVSPDQTVAACPAKLVREAENPPHHQVRPHWSLWLFNLEQAG